MVFTSGKGGGGLGGGICGCGETNMCNFGAYAESNPKKLTEAPPDRSSVAMLPAVFPVDAPFRSLRTRRKVAYAPQPRTYSVTSTRLTLPAGSTVMWPATLPCDMFTKFCATLCMTPAGSASTGVLSHVLVHSVVPIKVISMDSAGA